MSGGARARGYKQRRRGEQEAGGVNFLCASYLYPYKHVGNAGAVLLGTIPACA